MAETPKAEERIRKICAEIACMFAVNATDSAKIALSAAIEARDRETWEKARREYSAQKHAAAYCEKIAEAILTDDLFELF